MDVLFSLDLSLLHTLGLGQTRAESKQKTVGAVHKAPKEIISPLFDG